MPQTTKTIVFQVAAQPPPVTAPSWFTSLPYLQWTPVAAGVTNNLSPEFNNTTLAAWQRGKAIKEEVPPPPYQGNQSPDDIIQAGNGAAIDQTAKEMWLVANGGHSGYQGNESYRLVLNTATPYWQRVTDPTPFADLNWHFDTDPVTQPEQNQYWSRNQLLDPGNGFLASGGRTWNGPTAGSTYQIQDYPSCAGDGASTNTSRQQWRPWTITNLNDINDRPRTMHTVHTPWHANGKVWFPLQNSVDDGTGPSHNVVLSFNSTAVKAGTIPRPFSPGRDVWDYYRTVTELGTSGNLMGCSAFDSSTNRVWYHASNEPTFYSVNTNPGTEGTYRAYVDPNTINSRYTIAASAICPVAGRRLWVVLCTDANHNNGIRVFNLDLLEAAAVGSAVTTSMVQAIDNVPTIANKSWNWNHPVAGDQKKGWGMVWHEPNKAFLLYSCDDMNDGTARSRNLRRLTPPLVNDAYDPNGTWVCDEVEITGTLPTFVTGAPGSTSRSISGCSFTRFNIINDMGNGESMLVQQGNYDTPCFVCRLPNSRLPSYPTTLAPANYVVFNDGGLSGGNVGEIVVANIAAAVTAVQPGQVIELRNRVAGAATWAQVINLNKSGTASQPITLRVREGDSVRLKASGTLLSITGSYTVVRGNTTGRLGLELGDPAEWVVSPPSTTNNGQGYTQTNGLYVQSCSNVLIENSTIHGAKQYYANVLHGTASNIIMRNCEFSKHGTIQRASGGNSGDTLNVSSKRVLLEDCDFSLGGHNNIFVAGPYFVARRCTFDGNWVGQGTDYTGCRPADFGGGTTSNRIPESAWPGEYGPQLIEDCIIKNAGTSQNDTVGGPANNDPGHKLESYRPIFRGNFYYDNRSQIWQGPGYGGLGASATGEVMSRGYLYHNTSYSSGGVWRNISSTLAEYSDDQREYRLVNNVFALLGNGRPNTGEAQDVNVVKWDDKTPLGGYTNGWKGSVWRDNIFSGPATLKNFQLTQSTSKPVTDSTFWPQNIYRNTVEPTINFANAAARTRAGFAITSGPGFQDAVALTTTTSAGSGTSLAVADAGYFYDGWGITGETGDYIKVGSNAPVKITAANWTTNTLTLASSITWGNGDAVYFAGNDKTNNAGTLFDNRGAAQ
jgi:hypothetical protein